MPVEAAGLDLWALLVECRLILDKAGNEDSALDVRFLATETTGLSSLELATKPHLPVSDEAVDRLRSMISRRARGEPVHRILGYREFYGLRLALSQATLEPRPDTETLVDLVLPKVRDAVKAHGGCEILDLGTGTGAIALALLNQTEGTSAVATDISPEALVTMQENVRRHGLGDRLETLLSNWFERIDRRFHIIVANPPYVANEEIEKLEAEVRNYDPMLALDGGLDGLEAYRQIAAGARAHLHAGGCIGVEIGFGQRPAVTAIFNRAGFRQTACSADLGGRDRALLFAG